MVRGHSCALTKQTLSCIDITRTAALRGDLRELLVDRRPLVYPVRRTDWVGTYAREGSVRVGLRTGVWVKRTRELEQMCACVCKVVSIALCA